MSGRLPGWTSIETVFKRFLRHRLVLFNSKCIYTSLQGPAAGAAQPAADAAPPKRKGKGPAGPVLGKGTAVVRSIVDAAATGAAEDTAAADIAVR